MNFLSVFVFFSAHSFLLLQKNGRARPGSGIGLLDSPTGSSLPKGGRHQTNHRQSTGTMLANGHKGHQTSVGLSLPNQPSLTVCAPELSKPSSWHKSQSRRRL